MFRTVIRNMRLLSPRRKEAIGYSFLIMSRTEGSAKSVITNVHELLRAGHIAKDLGCDYLEIKAMLDPHHYVDAQAPGVVESLRAQLPGLLELETASFQVVLNSSALALLNGEPAVQVKTYTQCPTSELRTLVTPQGVYVCPYHRGDPRFRLGDAREGLVSVWASSDRGIVNPSKDCLFHCARHETNLAIKRIGTGVGERDMVDDYDPFI